MKTTVENTQIQKEIQRAIDLHTSMRNSYLWNSRGNASYRRWYEDNHSLVTEFEHDGQVIRVEQGTWCSCRNVYYKMKIFINGVCSSKDVRFLKKLSASLSA